MISPESADPPYTMFRLQPMSLARINMALLFGLSMGQSFAAWVRLLPEDHILINDASL